jgi:hypothetical protein
MAFTDRGIKSVKDECVTKVSLLWECLYHMATSLVQLHRENCSQIEKEYKEKTGWDVKRGEGAMTRADKRLMRMRKDTYRGKEIDIEKHVGAGNRVNDPESIRVYYCYDKETKMIIIGHCGSHIPNFTTQSL